MRAVLSAILVGIPKASGTGIRILGCGGLIRRTAGRAAARELHETCKAVCGEQQCGLQPDGTGKLHRLISATMATRPGVVVASSDIKDAFTTIDRDAVITANAKASVEAGATAEAWLSMDSTHIIQAEGATERVTQTVGLDQGHPLSPWFFCVGVAKPVDTTRMSMRRLDPKALVLSFLDDTYLIGTPEAVEEGIMVYNAEMKKVGLEMHMGKTRVRGKTETLLAEAGCLFTVTDPEFHRLGRLGGGAWTALEFRRVGRFGEWPAQPGLHRFGRLRGGAGATPGFRRVGSHWSGHGKKKRHGRNCPLVHPREPRHVLDQQDFRQKGPGAG